MGKKLLPLFIACWLCFQYAKAQYVTIPDPNFQTWIAGSNVGGCLNGLGQLDTTCQALLDDTLVVCSFNLISNLDGIKYFKNLKYLDCSNNLIDSLVSLPASLERLICSSNSIETFNFLPEQLKYLNCESNNIDNIPHLPTGLVRLLCGDNLLDSLPILPDLLDTLDCPLNFLTRFQSFPNSLRVLICYQNMLNQIPSGIALRYIDCSSNQITTLPNYDNLNYIDCSNNQINRLPIFSDSLVYLNCSYNNIDSVFFLPNRIMEIECEFNQMKYLGNKLPDSLQSLGCNDNLLSIIPSLPNNLTRLAIGDNQIIELPELPDSMNSMGCYNNPDLRCLPKLKRINYLGFDSTAITCIPNYGNVTNSTPPLNSLPLCDSTNNTGCPYYTSIPEIKDLTFSISPNPASNEALLILNEAGAEFSITVFDITGRKVITEKNHTSTCALTIGQLPAGLYFVQLSDDMGGVGTKKLVIEH